ncbi:MAG: DUF4355 domain-containing protein [Sedimentibacter sp.]
MENLENKENKEVNQELPLEQQNQQQEHQQEGQKIEMDIDQLKKWLVTEEGKKFFQPTLDRHFTKGLETWKTNNLEKFVNEKYEQLHPTDPKEQEILRLKKELAQKQIQDETIKLLEEAEIPVSFSDFFKSDNLETTKATVEKFVEHFNKAVNKEVTSRLPNSTPRSSGLQQQPIITKQDLAKMSYERRVQLYQNGYEHLFK